MSELDADLYGDLYGNDETDFAETGQEEKVDLGTSDVQESTPSVKVEPSSSNSPTTTKGETPLAVQTVSSVTQPIPTLQSPSFAPQAIPTYEQPQPADYNAAQQLQENSQNGSAVDRSVRPSEMKDEGKMFIGGLNWDTTDDGLRDYFTQFGKVDACTIMRDAAGRSRCFAFLTFEDPASVNAVMVREHFLDGKIIDPKRAIPRQEHQRATKLFIGGLAGSVTSESMREFFSQYGKVIDSTVMLDRETGRSKGFGFVSFEDTDVQSFLGFGNLEIDGKLIDVKLAQPRYQRDNYSEGGDTSGGGGGGGGGFQKPNLGNFVNNQNNFGVPGAGGAGGNTPFDPQALAALYTRMIQMTGAGQMNPAMMGMNPMMGGMGAFGGMRPGMMGGGMGAGMGGGMGMGGPMGGAGGGMPGMGAMGGMGRGGPQGMMQGGGPGVGMGGNIPRGPRGAPAGPAAMTGAGVGPQRAGQRGQHNYHPYAR